MSLAIRELTARDRYSLATLMRSVAGKTVDDRSPVALAFLTDPATFVFGAYHDDAPVGWAWGNVQRRPDGRIATYLHEIEVVPSARRAEVTSMLVRAVLARARRAGHHQVWLVTGADDGVANALYESLGSVRVGRGDMVHRWRIDG